MKYNFFYIMLIFGGLNYVINGTAAITVIVNDTYPKIKKVNICPECIYVSEVNLLMKECLNF